MKRCFFSRSQKGQGLVEYALILVLIAVIVIVILALLGQQVNQTFARVVLELKYPGQFHGPPASVTSLSASAHSSCGPSGCDVHASATVGLDVGGSPSVCVQFSCSGGGSEIVCGAHPSATLSGDASGSVQVCVIGVQGYSLVGGTVCNTTSY